MTPKKLISLLVVCALLSLPKVAKASDIDIQTDGNRVTVGADGGIKIESRGTFATNYPHQWRNPTYYRRSFGSRNCHWVRSNQRSQQTNRSGSGVTQTYSSLSTMVCR
jgi:hypothetical protein